MLGKLLGLRHNDFIRHNAIFFVGSMAVAIVNYLYYPIVGRLVSTSEFGEIQALLSVFVQITLLLSILSDVTVNVVTNSTSKKQTDRIVVEFGRLATLVMAVVAVLGLIFIEPLKHFLHFNGILPFVITGAVLIVNSSFNMRSAYLRGNNAYGRLSIASLITASAKLIASLALVLAGFGTSGAIGGLLVASILTWWYTRDTARRLGLETPKNVSFWRLPDMKLIKPQLPYALLVFVVSIVTTALFSIDVVLAKHYFSSQVAGEYAGVATIGRVIYFVTGSVAAVLLSNIKLQHSNRRNRQTFLRSLALTSFLGGGVLIMFALFPRFFIHLLIGQRYLPLANLLPKLSLTLFLISIVNLVFSYDVALRRWSIAAISVLGALVTIILVLLHHATPSAMINSLLYGTLFLLALRALDSVRRNFLHWGQDARLGGI